MKNTFVSFAFVLASVVTMTAQARQCPANARTEILTGLQHRSSDALQTEESQQQAVFVASLIIHSSTIACDFKAGILGDVYDLETATHSIHISFAGNTITNLQTKRVSFK